MTLNVLIVDRDEAYRARLAKRLARAPDVRVVGCSASGLGALNQAGLHRPDVVLLHLHKLPHTKFEPRIPYAGMRLRGTLEEEP